MKLSNLEAFGHFFVTAIIYCSFISFYFLFVNDNPFLFQEMTTQMWQFLPQDALVNQPIESFLFLHSRLPIENLIYLVGLKCGLNGKVFIYLNLFLGFFFVKYSLKISNFFTTDLKVSTAIVLILLLISF